VGLGEGGLMRVDVTADLALDGLDRLAFLAADLGTPMRTAALTLEQLVRQGFRDERDPFGHPWPAHSPVTLRERARRGQAGRQKLIDSGAMYGSIGHESDARSATAFVGTEYAPIQNAGNPNNTAWGRGHAPIPPRPFFPMDGLPEPWWAQVLAPLDAAIDAVLA
jgi:phage gpG-like protein